MYYDFTVRIPDTKGKIYIKKIKETTYINYEYDRIYKPEKKYNVPKRTTIGKQCPDDPDMMFPNENYYKFYPNEEKPSVIEDTKRSSCLSAGTGIVIKKVIEDSGLGDIVTDILGKDAGLFFDLAAYSIISENSAAQYYPDYAYSHTLFTDDMKIYSDSTISRFLNELPEDCSAAFLDRWNRTRDHREKIYISYDSTNKNCQSGNIDYAEFGYAKDDGSKPIFNYSVAYDKENSEPLFYEEYPGSVNDVSQFQFMLEKAKGYGYKHISFILDRGYFSKENIRFMDKEGFDFVIMMKGMKETAARMIRSVKGTFEEDRAKSIRKYHTYGETVTGKLYASDDRDRYFHVFYSSYKAAAEREAFETKIDRMTRTLKKAQGRTVEFGKEYHKYFDLVYDEVEKADPEEKNKTIKEKILVTAIEKVSAVNEDLRLCGYFVVITSRKMTARDALEIYKGRDASEKLFRGDKSYLGFNCMRVQSPESLDSRIFIEFVALIIRNRIYKALKNASQEQEAVRNYMTVPAAIRELEKLEMLRLGDGTYRQDHAVTKVQKEILKAFDISDIDVRAGISRIEKVLKEGGSLLNGKKTDKH